jgi:hypothetical protein
MKAAGWMIAGGLGSALLVAFGSGWAAGVEVLLGMLAPLAAVSVSWVLTERAYRRDPAGLMPLMMSAFAAKVVFFGGYVALMLKVVGLRPVPFVVSFTSYFIALYLIEALLMRRLFAGG